MRVVQPTTAALLAPRFPSQTYNRFIALQKASQSSSEATESSVPATVKDWAEQVAAPESENW